jgi:hypothetical protein
MGVFDALGCVVSIFVLGWALTTSPHRFQCPTGWWLPEGVRSSGAFTCRPTPIGDDSRNSTGYLIDHSIERHGFIEGQIYCPPDELVVIGDDGRTVSCHHR